MITWSWFFVIWINPTISAYGISFDIGSRLAHNNVHIIIIH